tara:strand:- start:105924 stop:107552 length:1629 start_codon:yes stop_codon:yes gene_type:complete
VKVVVLATWQQCIDHLKDELPSQQFNTWIRPLRAEPAPGGLILFAPNRFVQGWVREKFQGRISELLQHLNGGATVGVNVEVGEAAVMQKSAAEQASEPSRINGQQQQKEFADSSMALGRATGSAIKHTGVIPAANATHINQHQTRSSQGAPVGLLDGNALTGSGGNPISAEMDLRDHLSPAQSKMQRKPARNMELIIEGKLRHKGSLNPENTFENFIEGKSNQLARAAAMQVAENPGGAYNPLFIYGGVGLGKTHLMHAIGNYMVARNPKAKVVYLHSETFVATMVTALQLNAINEFKRYYRSVDALLIDDIQFFAGKERSQEEFFHTFNALLEGGQQIILTSDRYHKEINGLEERLKSRFGWGLSVAVEPPELETRAAILINKAAQSNVELPGDAAMFIAQRLRSHVRELEGALKKVMIHANFVGRPIDLDLVREALRDLFALHDKLVSIDNIQRSVAEYFKIKMSDMLSKRRNRSVARPRQIAMCLSKELTNHSLPEIGDAFGGRDHTTVLHACKQIKKLRGISQDLSEDYNNLLRALAT